MKTYDTLFAGLFLAAGIVYEVMAFRMPLGRIGQPGPGYFPTIVGAFLVLTAAACLIQALAVGRRGSPTEEAAEDAAPAQSARQTGKTWLLLIFLVLYVLALQPVGFPIALTVFLVASIWVFGYRKWLPVAGIAVALTVISYLTFVVWLKVPLPLGILSDLLD
ncbi:MAG: tripartite tricarboxylate transporter TctB family protein [candidate division NC10 bacterium]|nr:tripartite tricarboxylate transporter TctB family protein [candidate division NC10 bacterium]